MARKTDVDQDAETEQGSPPAYAVVDGPHCLVRLPGGVTLTVSSSSPPLTAAQLVEAGKVLARTFAAKG